MIDSKGKNIEETEIESLPFWISFDHLAKFITFLFETIFQIL